MEGVGGGLVWVGLLGLRIEVWCGGGGKGKGKEEDHAGDRLGVLPGVGLC